MKLWSDSWQRRAHSRDVRRGQARREGGRSTFSDNLNPHLAWSDVPPGRRRSR